MICAAPMPVIGIYLGLTLAGGDFRAAACGLAVIPYLIFGLGGGAMAGILAGAIVGTIIEGLICRTSADSRRTLSPGEAAIASETHLQGMLIAIQLTKRYVQQSAGSWPRSWDDLRRIDTGVDIDWLAGNVTMDFTADPKILREQSWHSFSAIRPMEPCFQGYEDSLRDLIELFST